MGKAGSKPGSDSIDGSGGLYSSKYGRSESAKLGPYSVDEFHQLEVLFR